MKEASKTAQVMIPVAAELFAAWIEQGAPKYRTFAAHLVQQGRYQNATTALGCIGRLASRFDWQGRRAAALTDAAQTELDEAAAIDAGTFRRTSTELRGRLTHRDAIPLDNLIRLRESVRAKPLKGEVDLNVKHSGTVNHNHRDLSWLTDDELDRLAPLAERAKAERAL